MPKLPSMPEPAPYAGTMSLQVSAHDIEAFTYPHTDVALDFNVNGVPSNVMPHVLKWLGRFGIATDAAVISTEIAPAPELLVITKDEIVHRASVGYGGRMWDAFEKVVTTKPECGLEAGQNDSDTIRGDFGFGLEWLSLNHTPLTASFIARKMLANRATSLGWLW